MGLGTIGVVVVELDSWTGEWSGIAADGGQGGRQWIGALWMDWTGGIVPDGDAFEMHSRCIHHTNTLLSRPPSPGQCCLRRAGGAPVSLSSGSDLRRRLLPHP